MEELGPETIKVWNFSIAYINGVRNTIESILSTSAIMLFLIDPVRRQRQHPPPLGLCLRQSSPHFVLQLIS